MSVMCLANEVMGRTARMQRRVNVMVGVMTLMTSVVALEVAAVVTSQSAAMMS